MNAHRPPALSNYERRRGKIVISGVPRYRSAILNADWSIDAHHGQTYAHTYGTAPKTQLLDRLTDMTGPIRIDFYRGTKLVASAIEAYPSDMRVSFGRFEIEWLLSQTTIHAT